jgi:hypothetical protein
MHEYREALYRMRRGERDRQISRDGVLGRHKLSILRVLAQQQGWLEPTLALPPEAQLLQALQAYKRAQGGPVIRCQHRLNFPHFGRSKFPHPMWPGDQPRLDSRTSFGGRPGLLLTG